MKRQKKGRNNELIQMRDQRLVARYYFYSSLMCLKYAKCLQNLSREFDLSENRIADIVAKNSNHIVAMERQAVTIGSLRCAYPFMNWQYNHEKMSQNSSQQCLALF